MNDKFYILKIYENDDTFWGVITLVGFLIVAGLVYGIMNWLNVR